MENINLRFKELRKHLKLSQRAFAVSVGVSHNTIAQVEMKTRNPSSRTISDISRAHNVNEEWLHTGEGEMFKKLDTNVQLMHMVEDLIKDEATDFKKNCIVALSNLPKEDWLRIESFLKEAMDK